MDGAARHALVSRSAEQLVEVLSRRMYAAIGVEAEQMKSVGRSALDCLLPDVSLEDRPARQRLVHQLGSLGEDPPRAECVVADLAIAHVVVGRQSDCRPVCRQLGIQLACGKQVECGCTCLGHRVAWACRSNTNTVSDDDKDRAGPTGERRVLTER